MKKVNRKEQFKQNVDKGTLDWLRYLILFKKTNNKKKCCGACFHYRDGEKNIQKLEKENYLSKERKKTMLFGEREVLKMQKRNPICRNSINPQMCDLEVMENTVCLLCLCDVTCPGPMELENMIYRGRKK